MSIWSAAATISAVRIGRLADSALVARRIAPVRKGVVASPAYLAAHGRPERPADLAGHDMLVLRQRAMALPRRRALGDGRIQSEPRTNNGEMLRAAARPASASACCRASSPRRDRDGSVDGDPARFPLEEGALHAVMPPGRAVTARVRALVDFLVARFGPEPAWDPCWLEEARKDG